jgi:hypothetical protein
LHQQQQQQHQQQQQQQQHRSLSACPPRRVGPALNAHAPPATRACALSPPQDGPDLLDPGEAAARAQAERQRALHDTLLAHPGRPLNAEQRAAVDAPANAPLLILAGAGGRLACV